MFLSRGYRVFLIASIALTTTHLLSQNTYQSLYWTRYYLQLKFTDKVTWHSEFDNRRLFDGNAQSQFISHQRLHYKISSKLDIAAGITYNNQIRPIANSTNHLNVVEIRPVQEMNYKWYTNAKGEAGYRLRIDDRFIRKNDGKMLLDGYNFNFRIRQRLLYNRKISKNLSAKLADEVMINVGKNVKFFDQNRLYLSAEYAFSKEISVELGYIRSYQKRNSGTVDQDILRFTIYNRFSLIQKD